MSHVFHNINGWLLVGLDVHDAAILWPVPYSGPALKLNFLHPFTLGDKEKPTVHFSGAPAVGWMHAPQHLWPHLPIAPFGLDVLMLLNVAFGQQMCWLPRTKVFVGGDWATCTVIPGPLSINLDCWEIPLLPTSLVLNPGTVVTTPDVWDYAWGVGMAVGMSLFNLAMAKGTEALMKWIGPRVKAILQSDFVSKLFPLERFQRLLARLPGASSRASAEAATVAGDPVDVATGHVLAVETDLEVRGAIPMALQRRYCSGQAHERGALGRGFTHSFEQWVAPEGEITVVRRGDGRDVYFRAAPPGEAVFHRRERLTLIAREDGSYVLRDVKAHLTSTFAPAAGGERARLSRVEDAHGNALVVEHAGGRPARVIDAEGRELTFEHDARGRLVRAALGADGREIEWVRYRHTRTGELAAVTDRHGREETFAYDEDHRLIRLVRKDGAAFTYEHDDRDGTCIRVSGEDELHEAVLARHAEAGVTLRLGLSPRTYAWNEQGLVTREATPDGVVLVERRYDDDGYLLFEQRAGLWREMEYDERGNLTRLRTAGGGETRYRYEGDRLVERDDGHGRVAAFTRDARGEVVEARYPSGEVYEIGYDERGQPGRLSRNGRPLADLLRDRRGAVVRARAAPGGAAAHWACDPLGRPMMRRDPLGETSLVTTVAGALTGVTGAGGDVAGLTLDRFRLPEAVRDVLGRELRVERAGAGATRRIVQPDGGAFTFGRDAEERLRSVENPLGERHELDLDLAGFVVAERTFDGRRIRYGRDAAGRVTRIDGEGSAPRALIFDEAGRIAGEDAGDARVSFSHDARGALMKARITHRGEAIETELTRDASGRVVGERCGERAIAYRYDGPGRRSARVLPGGGETRYTYDAAGALAAIEHGGARVAIERDGLGRITALRAARAAVRTGYDGAARLSSQRVEAGGEVRLARTFERDLAGQLLRVREGDRAVATYAYDAAGRLRAAEIEGHPAERFDHDAAGSLLARAAGEGAPTAFDLGPGNRLLRAGAVIHEHDARGRRIASRRRAGEAPGPDDAVTRYRWDGRDRLREVRLPSGERVVYTYDAFDRQVRREQYAPPATPAAEAAGAAPGAPARTTELLWDGDAIATRVDSVEGTTVYLHDPGSLLPLAEVHDGVLHLCVLDPVGAPTELVDPEGRVAWSSRRRPWGERAPTAGIRSVLGPAGQWEDEATGLLRARYRDFDPATARFLSPDPLGLRGGLNLYALAGAPTMVVDPLGLDAVFGGMRTAEELREAIFKGRAGTDGHPELFDKFYTFVLHGEPGTGLHVLPDGTVLRLTPEEIVDLIRMDPSWTGQPIILVMCHGADGLEASTGATVARHLGVDTFAARNVVSGGADGLFQAENWLQFMPDGSRMGMYLGDHPWALPWTRAYQRDVIGDAGVAEPINKWLGEQWVGEQEYAAGRALENLAGQAQQSFQAAQEAVARGDTAAAREIYDAAMAQLYEGHQQAEAASFFSYLHGSPQGQQYASSAGQWMSQQAGLFKSLFP